VTYPPPGNSDPYGQQPQQPSQDPFASPPPAYGQPTYGQPAYGEQPTPAAPQNPYDPYAQQPPAAPQSPAYGQQSPAAPQNPYDPYAQQQSPAPQYGQPYAPQYPAYGAPMADPNKNNGLAVGAMATGIAGIPLACCCGIFGAVASVVAIVLGIIANNQISSRGGKGKGMALTGIITGGVGVLIAIGLLIWGLSGGQESLINDIINSQQ
jgi:uncharacterized protein DUF4190